LRRLGQYAIGFGALGACGIIWSFFSGVLVFFLGYFTLRVGNGAYAGSECCTGSSLRALAYVIQFGSMIEAILSCYLFAISAVVSENCSDPFSCYANGSMVPGFLLALSHFFIAISFLILTSRVPQNPDEQTKLLT